MSSRKSASEVEHVGISGYLDVINEITRFMVRLANVTAAYTEGLNAITAKVKAIDPRSASAKREKAQLVSVTATRLRGANMEYSEAHADLLDLITRIGHEQPKWDTFLDVLKSVDIPSRSDLIAAMTNARDSSEKLATSIKGARQALPALSPMGRDVERAAQGLARPLNGLQGSSSVLATTLSDDLQRLLGD